MMEAKEEDDTIDDKDTTNTEDTQVEKTTNASTGPPTLDEMIADPIAFRYYVGTLADTTPRAPPDLHSEAFRNWEYRHLLTATLRHLLAVFANHASPRQQAWQYYQTWLIVNNTDYRDSPFMAFSFAKTLFEHEADGRRKCARVAAGLPEKRENKDKKGKETVVGKKRKKKKAAKKGGGGRRKQDDA